MLDRFLKIIAPASCVNCQRLSGILCADCRFELVADLPGVCYRCNRLSKQMRTCSSCRASSKLFAVYAVSQYSGSAKRLVMEAKFQASREAAVEIGRLIDQELPMLSVDLVVPVPTVAERVRRRGYDHALLAAKSFATQRGLKVASPLVRITKSQQLGADMKTRKQQLKEAMRIKPFELDGKSVLLIDDVISTGASLEASAEQLKLAGAKRIYAAVLARNL